MKTADDSYVEPLTDFANSIIDCSVKVSVIRRLDQCSMVSIWRLHKDRSWVSLRENSGFWLSLGDATVPLLHSAFWLFSAASTSLCEGCFLGNMAALLSWRLIVTTTPGVCQRVCSALCIIYDGNWQRLSSKC